MNDPTLLAFLPTIAELPAGWNEDVVTPDSSEPSCLSTALNGTGIGDTDPYPAEYAEVQFSQSEAGPFLNVAIYRGTLDLASVAERVKTCSGVADPDGAVHQIADLAVAPIGQGTYTFRDDITPTPGTALIQMVQSNGYVILGANVAATGTEDQLLLELTMALVAGRAV